MLLERLLDGREWCFVYEPRLPSGVLFLLDSGQEFVYLIPERGCFAYPRKAQSAYLLCPHKEKERYTVFEIRDREITPASELPNWIEQKTRDYHYPASQAFLAHWTGDSASPTVFFGPTEKEEYVDIWMPLRHDMLPDFLWPGSLVLADLLGRRGMKFAVWFNALERQVRDAIQKSLTFYPHAVFVYWMEPEYYRGGLFDFLRYLQEGRL